MVSAYHSCSRQVQSLSRAQTVLLLELLVPGVAARGLQPLGHKESAYSGCDTGGLEDGVVGFVFHFGSSLTTCIVVVSKMVPGPTSLPHALPMIPMQGLVAIFPANPLYSFAASLETPPSSSARTQQRLVGGYVRSRSAGVVEHSSTMRWGTRL